MNIVVDTSVWSLVLRRRRPRAADAFVDAFRAHVEAGDEIFITGVILQELLDGVRTTRDFDRLLAVLDPFPLVPVDRRTYVLAAQASNACRRKGVQAGSIDFLIAAACIQNGCPLLTADKDFVRIARHTDLLILPPLGPGD